MMKKEMLQARCDCERWCGDESDGEEEGKTLWLWLTTLQVELK